MVHRRNQQTTSTSGGFINQKTHSLARESKEVGSHLRIAPSARYDVKDGFGEAGPQVVKEFPRLLAADHLFVAPPEPEVIQMDDESVQCDPLLFKKELESIQDYQDWLSDTVDPFLKVSRRNKITREMFVFMYTCIRVFSCIQTFPFSWFRQPRFIFGLIVRLCRNTGCILILSSFIYLLGSKNGYITSKARQLA
jgi:hypothetical protein